MTKMREESDYYEAEDLVSVWVGTFPDQAAFDSYLEESWSDDGTVHCLFWEDLGIRWHDHDFQEAYYVEEPIAIATLLDRGFSWWESYRDAVLRACEEREIRHANAIVLLFEFDFPLKAHFSSLFLTSLGSFSYSTGGPPFRRN